MRRIPVAITIAGSDSGGGAGIQADLKTFSALGVYGVTAITSITAQNTYRVSAVHDLPGWFVYEQVKTIAEDMGIDAGKTGMLSNIDIVQHVARALRDFRFPAVVDPVMVAKSGAKLLRDDAVEALCRHILPLALVVTPNAMEASILSGKSVRNVEDAKEAARVIHEKYGTVAVIVKGGHLEEEKVVDVLYYRGSFYYFESPRSPEGCFHGAGCSYSAAIAAYIAKGFDVVEAVEKAKKFIDTAITYGVKVGKGYCPVNPIAWLELPAEKHRVRESVKRALEILLENSSRVLPHVPEVGLNVAEVIDPRYAKSVEDIAAVLGRVVKTRGKLIPVGPVEFGASSHLARLLLEAIKHDPEIRGALNVKYSRELIEKATAKGYLAVFVDRRREPDEVRKVEGMSIPWLVREAFRVSGKTPDLIYDEGGIGKEPMIRVIGRSAVDAVVKLLSILE
ncbi:MAG: bifunctional hydroxymethylpyrimidine kinase/phosphomethylpyrimidine kinase [Desulfurococcaceae archaeon]